MIKKILYTIASFLLVAAGQPDFSISACIMTGAVGYALFWKALVDYQTRRSRFFVAFLWFAAVSGVHLSWFAADRYVGSTIYLFLFVLLILLGALFAFFSLFVNKTLKLVQMLGLASLWTISEWARLFIMSGFTWNPVGLPLSATSYGMQMVAWGGVFSLTFWVIFTNLIGLKALACKSKNYLTLWVVCSCAPYLWGAAVIFKHEAASQKSPSAPLSVVLVQTALYPEEKHDFLNLSFGLSSSEASESLECEGVKPKIQALTPLEQWERILMLLQPYRNRNIDLIVLPEAVVPYGTDVALCEGGVCAELFRHILGYETSSSPLYASNSHFAGTIAQAFSADVIIGLEDFDQNQNKTYNAAFHFSHPVEKRTRYEKRVLVPMGEYIPFKWCKNFLKKYGITDSFHPGQKAQVFQGKKCKWGVSICYEETYGHLMRDNCAQGAEVLVNLTNDVWYPRSRLPVVHYMHGRLRAVEGGVPLVRACNTGVTCGVDSSGRLVGQLPYETRGARASANALHISLPTYHYKTFYSKWGDTGIIAFCLICLSFNLIFLRKNFY